MNSNTFSKRISRSTDNVNSRLRAFIKNQNPKNVHDMRTSIRRMEAIFTLLPRNIRKKQIITDYLSNSRSLFKNMSTIRDIDIVDGKIGKFEAIAEITNLLTENAEKRIQLLSVAMKSALALEKITIPRIKVSQISESKLAKRRKKVERKFEDYLDEKSTDMLSNPKPQQLHDFRINCKLLRYTLEIDSGKKRKSLEATLEDIQTVLGSLMDDYTTLRYLSEYSLGDAVALLVKEINISKDREYNRFARILKREFGKKL